MPRKQRYNPPTPGQRHDDLDTIDPAARPRRPAESLPSEGQARRRKRAVARRSRERVSPTGDYYYWCDHCDYCNLLSEGKKARCPAHAAAHEANRKATSPAPTGISDQILRRVHRAAEDVRQARQKVLIAERFPRDLVRAKENLDQAMKALLDAIEALPNPAARPGNPGSPRRR